MSCAIFSYASSLTSRAYAKRKSILLKFSLCALLLITMSKTFNQLDLSNVEKEVTIIQNTIERLMIVKLCELMSMKIVLNDLSCYNVVHFVCHDYANSQSSFQSDFLLCEDELEKSFDENIQNNIFTIEIVNSINTKRSQLVFLSIYYIAKNASVVLMNENIHLVDDFQLVEYSHVIAFLWEVDDDLFVIVVEKLYQILFVESNIVEHEKIVYALHDATLVARRICDDSLSWITIIHFESWYMTKHESRKQRVTLLWFFVNWICHARKHIKTKKQINIESWDLQRLFQSFQRDYESSSCSILIFNNVFFS